MGKTKPAKKTAKKEEINDMLVKRFVLLRLEDASGVSGTGLVAQGAVFANGWCALHWLSELTSVSLYETIGQLEEVHGHGGKTKIVFED